MALLDHLFQWFCAPHGAVTVNCLKTFVGTPEVATAILKFLSEFTFKRRERISFAMTSAGGYTLFSLVSEAVASYYREVQHLPKGDDDRTHYHTHYKGISICMTALSRSLTGGYLNFAVLRQSGEKTLDTVVTTSLRMMATLEERVVIAHKTVANAHFPLINTFAEEYTDWVVRLEYEEFKRIMLVIKAGLESFDGKSHHQCGSAIRHLAVYYHEYDRYLPPNFESDGMSRRKVIVPTSSNCRMSEAASRLSEHVQLLPGLFRVFMKAVIEIVVLEVRYRSHLLSRECVVQENSMLANSLIETIQALSRINSLWLPNIERDLIRVQPEQRRQHVIDMLAKIRGTSC